MQVVVTGATGFLGRALCVELEGLGHSVIALSRDASRARAILGPQTTCLSWGGSALDTWKTAVTEADAILHLAGESIAGKRWTPEYKARIRASRVETTRLLVDALLASNHPPPPLISASAVGYYGDCGESLVTEATPGGQDFLGEVCAAWEAEAHRATSAGGRVVTIRIGVVLGTEGALHEMLYPLPIPLSPWKLGLGGPLGSGKQWMSWVHVDDVVGMFLWAATHDSVQGAINATSPHPLRNREFARALGRSLHRPALFPVPAFALRLLLGEFAEFLLTGQRVIPAAAQRLGYPFRYPEIDAALLSLLP